MGKSKIIQLLSILILLLSIVIVQFFFRPKSISYLIQSNEEQYNEYLKSEYEQYKQNIFEISEDEDDGDDSEKNYKYVKNKNSLIKQYSFCSKRGFKLLNDSQVVTQNIKIYFDWDDQFNNIQSIFSPSIPQEPQEQQNQKGQQQQNLLWNVNDKIKLQMIENTSNETDIIFSQSSLIKGRFDWISSSLCYNQLFNHIPGSSFLYGKSSLIQMQMSSTNKFKSNLKCLLELDFYPKVFDLRNDCSSFEDYVNINHQYENKDVYYLGISGSYNKIYSNFKLQSNQNLQNLTSSKEPLFSCSEFWRQNNVSKTQSFLVQEISLQNVQQPKQANQIAEITNSESYFIRVNFLISSTKPLIVYCQNNELVFLKCKYGNKCNKRIKQQEFFKEFPSLNQEILVKKIFKAITHAILSTKQQFLEDSRVFELFAVEFSVQQKQLLKLEEIFPFSTIYKRQDAGYDLTQTRFLKESLTILTQQFIHKNKLFQQVFSQISHLPSDEIYNKIKKYDRNDEIYLHSNFIEVIINENHQGQQAYKYISPHCI